VKVKGERRKVKGWKRCIGEWEKRVTERRWEGIEKMKRRNGESGNGWRVRRYEGKRV